MSAPLLSVEDLCVEFRTRAGIVQALDGVTFDIREGEIVGIAGESGSGKSVTAYTMLRILDAAARIPRGRIVFGGVDLLQADEAALRDIRGREIAMIFQNPRAALHPILPVGRQIADVLRRHESGDGQAIDARVSELLASVRIADPERRRHAYPFELSGGMCQRVMIAMALSCAPKLLIADEPTTGLDVTTQATIMDLIRDLVRSRGMSAVLITHDLALAAEYCDRLVIMHAGHVVEIAPRATLFAAPRHPYTARLLAATPRNASNLGQIGVIPGALPDLREVLPPCRYSARCERHESICDRPPLQLVAIGPDHVVACRRPL